MKESLRFIYYFVFVFAPVCTPALLLAQPAAEDPSHQEEKKLETPAPEIAISPRALSQFQLKAIPEESGRIAFTAEVDSVSHILVLDLSSRRVEPLVATHANDSDPAWSPSGKELAFVSDRTGTALIYITNWEGTETRRLTQSSLREGDPNWHPSGSKIIYYREESNRNISNLFVSEVSTGKTIRVTSAKGRTVTPKYSPSASQLAFSTNRNWPGWDACILTFNGRTERCIPRQRFSVSRPAWASSGDKLFYSFGSGNEQDIAAFSLKTGSRSAVTSLPGKETDIEPAPAGDELLFIYQPESGSSLLYLQRPGSEPKLMLSAPFTLRSPSWTKRTILDLEVERIKETTKQAEEEAERARLAAEEQALMKLNAPSEHDTPALEEKPDFSDNNDLNIPSMGTPDEP